MLAYSIETALNSGLVSDVYVCTEDEQIALVAREYGACVPFLMPPELCGDLMASHIPCQHLAASLIAQGHPIQTLVCLQPTSPLRSVGDLNLAMERFGRGDIDYLVSVTPVDPHYFHWALISKDNGEWQLYFRDQYLKERPLLPRVYRPNGSIKIARLSSLQRSGHFFGTPLAIVETSEERSVHVGAQFDFDLCEFLLGRQGEL